MWTIVSSMSANSFVGTFAAVITVIIESSFCVMSPLTTDWIECRCRYLWCVGWIASFLFFCSFIPSYVVIVTFFTIHYFITPSLPHHHPFMWYPQRQRPILTLQIWLISGDKTPPDWSPSTRSIYPVLGSQTRRRSCWIPYRLLFIVLMIMHCSCRTAPNKTNSGRTRCFQRDRTK